MTASENTSLTLRLPKSLRDRIKRAADADHRTESQFIRFHLTAMLEARKATRRKSA